jgi:hypothetical protein
MKYVILFIGLVLASCSTPIKVIESYSTDSTGKTIKTITKVYDNTPVVRHEYADNNYFYDPFYFRPYGYRPYGYYPRTQIIVPFRTPVRPSYGPRYTPRNNPHH